ncbi:PPM-type phosphatase domain-containing protein, partial [Haematococcus lacustris]
MSSGVAAVIELVGEPFYLLCAVNLQFRLRVVMDSLPLAVRALVTLGGVTGWPVLVWLQAEKLVLAEGSKMVMAGLSSSYDQGVLGLVGNLGSLLVRTLFQPLEELAFTLFSRHRVSASDTAAMQQLAVAVRRMVKGMALLGLLVACMGPPFSWLALRLVYGQRWADTQAPQVLALYCAYILLLAVNGEWAGKRV